MADNINIQEVFKLMTGAAKEVLKEHWKEIKPFAEQEFKSYARNIHLIGKLKLKGEISLEQSQYYLKIQRSSIRTVLLTIEGLGIIAVENAINAAINIVRDTVNKTIGWSLI